MLPSQSSLSTDTSLLPICGGTPTVPGRAAGSIAGEADATADFDALFADLSAPTAGDDVLLAEAAAAGIVPLLGLPVETPPVAINALPATAAAPGTGEAPGAADGEVAVDPAASRASVVVPWAQGRSALLRHAGTPSAPTAAAAHAAAHAAAPAALTPGAVDLPGLRIGATVAAAAPADPTVATPAGVTPAAAVPAAAPRPGMPAPAVPAELPAEGASPLPAAGSTGNAPVPPPAPTGREQPFQGAALSRPDHPSDAAQLALERNGFSATTPPADRVVAASAHVPVANGRTDAALPPGRAVVRAGEEKFAVRTEANPRGLLVREEAREKHFLTNEGEEVVTTSRHLGIDGAKSPVAMPASPFSAPAASVQAVIPAQPSSALATAEVANGMERPEAIRTAHEAVEVVLHAVEHVATRAQSAVQLKLSVAGEELAVRVELRADEVRTTFRTDSSELRAALAHEWQQVAGGLVPVERPVRVAPAVFAPVEQSGLNASAGDTSSRERNAGTRRGDEERAVVGWRARPTTTVASVSLPAAAPAVAAPRTGGSHRLHTLA